MSIDPREADASLHTSLLSAMLGASIGFAIQNGFQDPDPVRIAAIVALVLHAVNFYHGKLIRLYDRLEQLTSAARPTLRGGHLLSNTLLFLTFSVMALRVDSAVIICVGEMLLRIIDSTVIAAQLRVGDKSPGKRLLAKPVRRQLRYWLGMNTVCFAVFAAVLIAVIFLPPDVGYNITVAALVALVVVDLAIEYGVFSVNYFNELSDWDRLAVRWDRLQGDVGDKYRQELIHPLIRSWASEVSAGGELVLVDAGCGNGCSSRALALAGYPVVSFDASKRLIEIAGLYDSERIRYLVASLEASETATRVVQRLPSQEKRRAAIAVFSMQDCGDLNAAFNTMAGILRPGEPILLLFESALSYSVMAPHSTTIRSWKYSLTGEKVQVVSWLPVTSPDPTSVCADIGDNEGELISVVTHYRDVADYSAAASAAGFDFLRHSTLYSTARPRTLPDLEYQDSPKFEFAIFVRTGP